MRKTTEGLFDNLIIQARYTGNICLSDSKMIDYVKNAVSLEERRAINAHLLECSICSCEVQDLKGAAEWFDQRRMENLEEFERKAKEARLIPWYHLAEDPIFFCYIDGLIPDTPAGKELIADIEAHLESCYACREQAEKAFAVRKKLIEIQVAELKNERIKKMEAANFIKGIVAAVIEIQQNIQQKKVQMEAYAKVKRSGEYTITAVVLDTEGKLELDAQGNPVTVDFDVVQKASVDNQGFFFIKLLTENRSYSGKGYKLEVSLQHDNTNLIFSPQIIYRNGQITVNEKIEAPVEKVESIPNEVIKEMIRLIVKPA